VRGGGNLKYKCSFCPAETDRIISGWGYVELETPGGKVGVTFCPKHRKEAEEKLDIVFGLPQAHPKA
jgi:hypothetical protein